MMWGTLLAMILWASCRGASVAATVLVWATDSRGCLPPYQGGAMPNQSSGSTRIHIRLRVVEIIHIIGRCVENWKIGDQVEEWKAGNISHGATRTFVLWKFCGSSVENAWKMR